MLVLSRREDERFVMLLPGTTPVYITVVKIKNHDAVRIGIDAPHEVLVYREEVYEDMQRRKQSAPDADERARTPEGPPIDIKKHAERGGLCGPVAKVEGDGE